MIWDKCSCSYTPKPMNMMRIWICTAQGKTPFLQSNICSVTFVFHKCQYMLYELNMFPSSTSLFCQLNKWGVMKMRINYPQWIMWAQNQKSVTLMNVICLPTINMKRHLFVLKALEQPQTFEVIIVQGWNQISTVLKYPQWNKLSQAFTLSLYW